MPYRLVLPTFRFAPSPHVAALVGTRLRPRVARVGRTSRYGIHAHLHTTIPPLRLRLRVPAYGRYLASSAAFRNLLTRRMERLSGPRILNAPTALVTRPRTRGNTSGSSFITMTRKTTQRIQATMTRARVRCVAESPSLNVAA